MAVARPLERALLRQPFFAAPQTRTIPRIAAWLEKIQHTPRATREQTELRSRLLDASLSDVAASLLGELGLLRIPEVTDVETGIEHLGAWLVDGLPTVLTDTVIAQALAAVPGGQAVLATTTPADLRAEMSRQGFGPEQLGHERLAEFLSRDDVAPGAKDAANRILCEPRRSLGVLLNSLAAALSPAERSCIEAIHNEVGSAVPTALLVAPDLRAARSALAAYVEQDPPGLDYYVAQDLRAVFDPTGHYQRADRNYGGQRVLMEAVYEELVATSLLAHSSMSPAENLRRVATSLDVVDLDHNQLRAYPRLYRLCRVGRERYSAPDMDPRPEPVYATLSEAYSIIEQVARDRGMRRGARLVLPSRRDFQVASGTDDAVAVLELQTGVPYEATLAYLARTKSYALPNHSEPERLLNNLVTDALADRLAAPLQEQYTDAERFARRRFDLYAPVEFAVPGEMLPRVREYCFEADGIQHFTSVEYWGGDSRVPDRRKARMVINASRHQPISLVALHHGVLGGAKRHRLSADGLLELVEYVNEHSIPWAFVRPAGSRDLRAYPSGLRPQLVEGLLTTNHVEVFAIADPYDRA